MSSTLEKALKNVKEKNQENKKAHVEVKVEEPKTEVPKRDAQLERGVVYLTHVPHGFFENEMKAYFLQFGHVTRVRVARSKKNGKSRGYAYVEMANTDVAKIAADSMNNYLMGSRLVKARYIAPAQQKLSFFMGESWNKNSNPKSINRRIGLKQNRAVTSIRAIAKKTKRSLLRLDAVKSILKAKGVAVEFQPINVLSRI